MKRFLSLPHFLQIVLPVFLLYVMGVTVFLAMRSQDTRGRAASTTDCTVSSTDISMTTTEKQVFDLINQYRAENNLHQLQDSSVLRKAAAWMSNDMLANSYMSHTDSLGRSPVQRLPNCGYTNPSISEIIQNNSGTPATVVSWWKGSSGHNAIMLSSTMKYMGVAQAGKYWTVDFGTTSGDNTKPSATSTPIPSKSPTVMPSPSECVKSGSPVAVGTSVCASGFCQPYTCTAGSTIKGACTGETLIRLCDPNSGTNPSGTPTPSPKITLSPSPTGIKTSPTVTGVQPTRTATVQPTQPPAGPGTAAINAKILYLESNTAITRGLPVTLTFQDVNNKVVGEAKGNLNYSAATNAFTGVISLPNSITNGRYFIKLKGNSTLRSNVSETLINVNPTVTLTLPDVILTPGDLDGSNSLTLLDYNLLVPCVKNGACNEGGADLNFDGKIDILDYNLMLLVFKTVLGD